MKLKSWETADSTEPIFQPESVRNGDLPRALSKRDFEALCDGDETAAHKLFNLCEWEDPAAVIADCGGLEKFVYGGRLGDIKSDYGLSSLRSGGLFNRVTVKGREQVEIIFPFGLDYSILSEGEAGMAERREAVRNSIQEGFKGIVSPAEDGSLVVTFSPCPEPSRDYPLEIDVRCYAASSGIVPAPRASILLDNMPDAFHKHRLHKMMEQLFESRFVSFGVVRSDSHEQKIVALHRGLVERCAKYAGDDPRVPTTQMDFFKTHYGVERGTIAMNRGVAYVGPIVHEANGRYYQLDKISNQIAVHNKDGIDAQIYIGLSYSIWNSGGLNKPTLRLPDVVADALARDVLHTKRIAESTHKYPAGLLKAGASAVNIAEIDLDAGRGVQFRVGDIEVGTGIHGAVSPAPLDEAQAKALAHTGLAIDYVSGYFFVNPDELKLAAYEKLGWYQPEKLIDSTAVSAWIQTALLTSNCRSMQPE